MLTAIGLMGVEPKLFLGTVQASNLFDVRMHRLSYNHLFNGVLLVKENYLISYRLGY